MSIILGVDPGFHITGYGILKKEASKISLIDYGCLTMSSTKSLSERTSIFYDFFEQKIQGNVITNVALETPFLGKNAQNFLKLGYLRGILYLLAYQNSCTLHEFAPRQVKQTVTGYGGASKDQVSRVVQQLFASAIKASTFDVTDALAVTLCGVWQQKSREA